MLRVDVALISQTKVQRTTRRGLNSEAGLLSQISSVFGQAFNGRLTAAPFLESLFVTRRLMQRWGKPRMLSEFLFPCQPLQGGRQTPPPEQLSQANSLALWPLYVMFSASTSYDQLKSILTNYSPAPRLAHGQRCLSVTIVRDV